MEFYGDYHIHTRYSDAKQDIAEIVEVAVRLGLKEIAITDHGPLAAVIGVKSAEEYRKIKKEIEEVNAQNTEITVLLGAEANIRDLDGTLDIPPEIIKELDLLIAGLHPYTLPTSVEDGMGIFVQNSLRHLGKRWRQKAITANTEACVAALYNNPEIDILSHPGLFFEVDYEEIAKACVQNEVLFEINCGHEHPGLFDIIKAEKVGADFIVNSDSHFLDTVGDLEYGSRVIEKLGINPQRVVNSCHRGGYLQWGKKEKACTYS